MPSSNNEEGEDSDHPVARLERLQDGVLQQLNDLNDEIVALLDEVTESRAISDVREAA